MTSSLFTNEDSQISKFSVESFYGRLHESELFKSYREIFRKATGLPLEMCAVNSGCSDSCDGGIGRNRFCRMLNNGREGCHQCVLAHRCLASGKERGIRSVTCFANLQETAVPVMQGSAMVAQLRTGQVFLEKPTRERFAEVMKALESSGVDGRELEEAYLETPVFEKKKYQAMVTLLAAFSLQLSELAGRMILEMRQQKSGAIDYAMDFIEENLSESIHLNEVAAEVNMSPFYFCRRFKEATGMTLTHYISHCRVKLAEEMLLHTTRRVADIAFEVGFQSLSQFNRSFLKLAGQSPTEFRKRMKVAA
jgi:AraC-like DNA-binding protein/ligand-binding sensor protein